MKRIIIIFIMMFLFSLVNVSAAMDPLPAYCTHQGYEVIRIYSTEYEGNYLEKWSSLGKTDIKFNDSSYEINTSRRETLEINKIVLGINSTYGDLNWSDAKNYCFFDETNKCDLLEFHDEKCGQEYKKEIFCRKEGEVLFPYFEECCEGLESSSNQQLRKIIGQSTCVKKMNFFLKLLRWLF